MIDDKIEEPETYQMYRLYGTLGDMPVGKLDADATPLGQDPLEFANSFLKKRGHVASKITGPHTFKNAPINSKALATTFIDKNSSFIDTEIEAGMPCIIIHPDGLTDQSHDEICESIGIGFHDIETAEEMLIKMVLVVEHLRKENAKKNEEG